MASAFEEYRLMGERLGTSNSDTMGSTLYTTPWEHRWGSNLFCTRIGGLREYDSEVTVIQVHWYSSFIQYKYIFKEITYISKHIYVSLHNSSKSTRARLNYNNPREDLTSTLFPMHKVLAQKIFPLSIHFLYVYIWYCFLTQDILFQFSAIKNPPSHFKTYGTLFAFSSTVYNFSFFINLEKNTCGKEKLSKWQCGG